jgi:hypothetical protein
MNRRLLNNKEILVLSFWIIFTVRWKMNSTLSEWDDEKPSSSVASLNAIYYDQNTMVEELQRVDIYTYSEALCPELASAYEYYLKNHHGTDLSVAMVQLVGKWSEMNMTQLMRHVFQHNARLVRHHKYRAIPIVKVPDGQLLFPENELNSPSFWKMQAVRNVCLDLKPDIVWFLDGDVVLMNPTYRIDILWEYHRQWADFDGIDILFSHDMNGINSGAFIVNCTSILAMIFLQKVMSLSYQVMKMPGVDPDLFEQNAIHYLLDTPQWKSSHVRPRRKFPDEDWALFSPEKLKRRIRTTLQPCSMFTLPLIMDHPCTFDQGGPLWYEFGHGAIHTAGMRQINHRSSYLFRKLKDAKKVLVDQKSLDSKSTIERYLRDQRNRKSVLRIPCKELYSI